MEEDGMARPNPIRTLAVYVLLFIQVLVSFFSYLTELKERYSDPLDGVQLHQLCVSPEFASEEIVHN